MHPHTHTCSHARTHTHIHTHMHTHTRTHTVQRWSKKYLRVVGDHLYLSKTQEVSKVICSVTFCEISHLQCTCTAHWVTSFITSRPVCVYSCSQLRELWFNDLFMYLFCSPSLPLLSSSSLSPPPSSLPPLSPLLPLSLPPLSYSFPPSLPPGQVV